MLPFQMELILFHFPSNAIYKVAHLGPTQSTQNFHHEKFKFNLMKIQFNFVLSLRDVDENFFPSAATLIRVKNSSLLE